MDYRRYFGELKKGAALAALGVTLVTLGMQATLVKALGLEDAITLAQVFFRTAPLTLAFMVITFLVVDAVMESDGRWPYTLVFSALVLWLSTLIGNWLGALKVEPARVLTGDPANPFVRAPFYLVNMGVGYYRAYGPAGFWSSLILGVFLFWALGTFLVHYFEEKQPDAGKVEAHRKRRLRIRRRRSEVKSDPEAGPD